MPYLTQVRAAITFLRPIFRGDTTQLIRFVDNWCTTFTPSHVTKPKVIDVIKRLSQIVVAKGVSETLINISATGNTTPTKGMCSACMVAIPNCARLSTAVTDRNLNLAYDILYKQIMEPILKLFENNHPALSGDNVAQGLHYIVGELKEFPHYIQDLTEDERKNLIR